MCFTFCDHYLAFRQVVCAASNPHRLLFYNIVYIKKMQITTFIYIKRAGAAATISPDCPESAESLADSSCHRARNSFHTL